MHLLPFVWELFTVYVVGKPGGFLVLFFLVRKPLAWKNADSGSFCTHLLGKQRPAEHLDFRLENMLDGKLDATISSPPSLF